MPSAAQVHGARIVDAILAPVAGTGMDIRTVPSRVISGITFPAALSMRAAPRDTVPPSVLVSVTPHPNKGYAGENRQTLTLPLDEAHSRHETVHARIAQLVGRWAEVARVVQEFLDETADASPADMDRTSPQPAHRINCPLILRTAFDMAGLTQDERRDLAYGEGSILFDGIRITVDDIDKDNPAHWGRSRAPAPSVRRATITGPGFKWTQGVTQHYLDLQQQLPATVLNAARGMHVGTIVGASWLAKAPGVTILTAKATRKGTRLELSRAFGHLGGAVPLIGHEGMGLD